MFNRNGRCPICGNPFPCLDHYAGRRRLTASASIRKLLKGGAR